MPHKSIRYRKKAQAIARGECHCPSVDRKYSVSRDIWERMYPEADGPITDVPIAYQIHSSAYEVVEKDLRDLYDAQNQTCLQACAEGVINPRNKKSALLTIGILLGVGIGLRWLYADVQRRT